MHDSVAAVYRILCDHECHVHSCPIRDKMAVFCRFVVLQAAAATISTVLSAHLNLLPHSPMYPSALTVTKTVAKRPRSDRQDASRPGPAVTPQAKDSAAAVEQLASLQCRLSLKGVAKKPVTDLAGKAQAVLPLSTYSEAVSRGEQAPIQGRAGHTV